jgi:lysophospholipase L1-like esterase
MPTLLIVGDSYAAGGWNAAGTGMSNLGAILAAHLKADLLNRAIGGTGYVNTDGGQNFLQRINAETFTGAEWTLFSGTLNDQTLSATTVQANATACYQRAKVLSPNTRLVVVGPQWPRAERPSNLLGIRNAVRTAAQAAGALWIDPLDGKWFDGPDTMTPGRYIGVDGWHPTNLGHAFIARQIALAMGVLPPNL